MRCSKEVAMKALKKAMITLQLLAALLIDATASYAKVMTFTREYSYQASEADSKLSCRTIALEQVKRLLLEKLGTYLESQTEVKNFKMTKDQVTILTAGIVSTEVTEERWNGKTYWLRAQIVADPAEVAQSVNRLRNDREKSRELEDVRAKANEASKELENLKKDISKLKGPADTQQMQKYNAAVKKLSATDWFEKGVVLGSAKQHNDAIAAFDKTLELNPRFAEAYNNRGSAYSALGNYKQAIRDFDKSIELNPQDASVYYNRGTAYSLLGDHQQAIQDHNKTIELNPQSAAAYSNRGLAYSALGDKQMAIKDYDKAIELNPQDAIAYYNRGNVNSALGNYQLAMQDYSKAIDLNPQYATAYGNRGLAYENIGNHQQAIWNYDKAIELNPKYAVAYYNRGNTYSALGNHQQAIWNYDKAIELNPSADFYTNRGFCYGLIGNEHSSCADFRKACELGDCKVLNMFNQKGLCD
jgi:tetratricopeptide (TPR) repeat protein